MRAVEVLRLSCSLTSTIGKTDLKVEGSQFAKTTDLLLQACSVPTGLCLILEVNLGVAAYHNLGSALLYRLAQLVDTSANTTAELLMLSSGKERHK